MATGGGKPRQPAARILPAAPSPIPLDSLFARAGALAQPHTVPRPKAGEASAAPSRPRVSPHDDTTPSSVVLPVSVAHCSCGATVRSPAAYVLVRYAPNSHTFHYRATGLDAVPPALLASLPHETRETHYDIPFCEECF
jgi:hypothetical protein